MKIYSFLLIAILSILSSCKEDNPEYLVKNFEKTGFPQTWKLVSMSGNVASVPPTTGKDMFFQETYTLNSDGTFTKTREQSGVSKVAKGKYSFKVVGSDVFLIFTHDTENELIGNCYATLDEELVLQNNHRLNSTWQACDGPGLIYEKQ